MVNSCAKQVAEVMSQHKRIVVLTGAGISSASGVPVYSEGGVRRLWNGEKHHEIYNSDTPLNDERFIAYTREFQDIVAKCKPNVCHHIVRSWINKGTVAKVLTQNVDGYHGRKGVIELHGNIHQMYCSECGKKVNYKYYDNSHRCNAIEFSFDKGGYHQCKGYIRPDVTLFGEDTRHLDAAMLDIYLADLVLVLGTSLSVSPVNLLPAMAKKNGSTIVVINRDPITALPQEYIDYAMYGEDLVSALQDIDYHLQCLVTKNGKSEC